MISSISSGLTEEDQAELLGAVTHFPAIQKAALFGSRSKGTFRSGSDVDMVLWIDAGVHGVASALKARLEEETSMPYFFDVIEYTSLKDELLKKEIDQHQLEFYVRT
jgi:predicted nucleotidyltransferase